MSNLRDECKIRRRKLLVSLGADAIAIVAGARNSKGNDAISYPYRQSSNFYYLTGFVEPDAIAVFIPCRKEGEYILFNRERDQAQEIWMGKSIGQIGARKRYDADQSFPISAAGNMLPDLILGKRRLYFDIGRDGAFDNKVMQWLNVARNKMRTDINVPDDITHIGKIIHEMRLHKSPYEIELIRKSASIASAAHLRAMRVCRPGMFEYQLEAELLHEYMRCGGRMPAFAPIVAGGSNACTLHYVQNDSKLKNGQLVLLDSGVDYRYYVSDITRTFPIGKKFSKEQKAIYQAVLDTQLAVIEKIRPGTNWFTLQKTSEIVISKKLLTLGILKGDLKKTLAKKTFKQFYMHNIGHWLGIDVHCVGKYVIDGNWRALETNMVLTIEPGIYIPAKSAGVDEKWWNIGVRIEDEILVTQTGCEVLTSILPKTIDEIEKLRA